jgi:hypothetical protein
VTQSEATDGMQGGRESDHCVTTGGGDGRETHHTWSRGKGVETRMSHRGSSLELWRSQRALIADVMRRQNGVDINRIGCRDEIRIGAFTPTL